MSVYAPPDTALSYNVKSSPAQSKSSSISSASENSPGLRESNTKTTILPSEPRVNSSSLLRATLL